MRHVTFIHRITGMKEELWDLNIYYLFLLSLIKLKNEITNRECIEDTLELEEAEDFNPEDSFDDFAEEENSAPDVEPGWKIVY